MTIEIVAFPIENGGSFHSYVSSPEGIQICHASNGHIILRPTLWSTFPAKLQMAGIICKESMRHTGWILATSRWVDGHLR
jgi:hypothetical protein